MRRPHKQVCQPLKLISFPQIPASLVWPPFASSTECSVKQSPSASPRQLHAKNGQERLTSFQAYNLRRRARQAKDREILQFQRERTVDSEASPYLDMPIAGNRVAVSQSQCISGTVSPDRSSEEENCGLLQKRIMEQYRNSCDCSAPLIRDPPDVSLRMATAFRRGVMVIRASPRNIGVVGMRMNVLRKSLRDTRRRLPALPSRGRLGTNLLLRRLVANRKDRQPARLHTQMNVAAAGRDKATAKEKPSGGK